jgi:hypothetical protein
MIQPFHLAICLLMLRRCCPMVRLQHLQNPLHHPRHETLSLVRCQASRSPVPKQYLVNEEVRLSIAPVAGKATASAHFVTLSTATTMYLFPFFDRGNGSKMSIPVQSHGFST